MFRWLHITWAIAGAGACTLLATATGGHPPGIVFVPIAAVIWAAGHALLWLSHKAVIRGRMLAASGNRAPGKWPPSVFILAFLSGAVSFLGFFGIIWLLLDGHNRIRDLLVPLIVWLPTTICFIGTLLRKDWSRILAASGIIVAAVVLMYEMIASFMRGYRNSSGEWVAAVVVFAVLVFLGQHILRSPGIKAFYAGNNDQDA